MVWKVVYCKNVIEGSEMDKIGVVDNFIVMEINGKPVNSQKDVEKILNGYKGNVQVKYVDSYGRITTRGFKMP
jgi:S1-C subfamily serine protease